MANQVYSVHRKDEYKMAGLTDLVRLLPAPGCQPIFIAKWVLEVLVYGISHQEFMHLSGPTGTAKSSLLQALHLEPENFQAVCRWLGFPVLPLKVYAIEMATYESPGELYQRRALRNGTTFDEQSMLVDALVQAAEAGGRWYPLIWLREMGRVHSPSVQGGLLDLMTKGFIDLPGGRCVRGEGIAWVSDSNYQAQQDANHTLVAFDDALKRRFRINVTMNYLSGDEEILVMEQYTRDHDKDQGQGSAPKKGACSTVREQEGCVVKKKPMNDGTLLKNVVKLGQKIRKLRSEGNLQSVPPPTISGYQAFLDMATALPHLSLDYVAMVTLLGNAGSDDRKLAFSTFNEVFGMQTEDPADPTGTAMF